MLIQELASTSRALAATASRREKAERLAALLRRLGPDEIVPAVALLAGTPRQKRIGVGPAAVKSASKGAHADLPTLGIGDVDHQLDRIATLSGAGSASGRAQLLSEMFRRATPDEADWLGRVLLGEVRQGALAGQMEDALSRATGIPLPEIRRAAMLSGDLGAVAQAALTEGRAGLTRFRLELFRPVLPMLASPADTLDEAMESLGTAALEYKIDGARVQVHKQGDEVRVFTRLLNDVTVAVPELVERVRALPAREAILDGEVIALKPDGTPHPFQVTMRRFGRRLDVEALRRELPLSPWFFDLLRRDGQDLLDAPFLDRSAALADLVPDFLVPRRLASDVADAEAFFDEALERGHEGIMAKALSSPYAAGSRGVGWFKVKPAHTLDLVVLAVEPGSGRRSGWLSNIHLGARQPQGGFAMIGKTFKGMTDAMLEWQTRRFRELTVGTDGYVVHLRPEQVVEVAFNDVQESPVYASGVALRFARVKRYRDDKPPGEADTLEAVYAILRGQVTKTRKKGPGA